MPGLNGKVNDTLIKTPKSPTDDCENVHPAMLWPASNLSSPTTGNCSLNQNDSKMMPPPAMPLRRPSAQMIASDGLPSSNIKADVSNASSSVIPHFPNVAGNSLPNSLNQRAYLSPQYSAMSECAPMIAEYPSSYRTISEMKSDAVPKLEPLPDPPSLCSNSYQATSPDLDARSTQMCLVPSMKNSVTQCSDLYSNSHNYEYPSSNLYSGTMVKNESEARLSVEDLSAFATSRSAGNGLPFNSMSMLDSSNMGGMKLPCSQNALNGNDSSSYVVSPTFQMNSVMTHGNVLSSAATRSSYPKNDKILTLDLSDSASADGACSSYNHNAKKKSFQFDKLFEAKSQQALVSCSMKNSANYENARDAVCFKNTQSASEPNMPMYQNYLNLENARTLNSSESVRQSYNKLDENKMVASLDVVKSSMMLNEVSSLMEGPTQMARKASSDAYALPISKTYQTARSLNGADGSSLMNSQSEESVMNEFVSAPMVDNAINTVPKLEELVNCAAENHIRSANKSATSAINLLNNSAMSNMYLTNETSRANGNCNDMPNAISPSRTSVSENPLLACTDDLSSYQRATNAPRNDIEATNATNKSSDSMELKNMNVKQDKTVNVPGMTKKTEEGVFSSDISRMTETDLLSYINPSCFDEVQR